MSTKEYKHVTKDGRVLSLNQMSSEHIINTIFLHARKIKYYIIRDYFLDIVTSYCYDTFDEKTIFNMQQKIIELEAYYILTFNTYRYVDEMERRNKLICNSLGE
jgi:hypothetical protein